MSLTSPVDLAPEVYPLAALLGIWRGRGTIGYHEVITPANVISEIILQSADGPYLAYQANTWLLAPTADSELPDHGELTDNNLLEPAALDGRPAGGRLWHSESGYWRIPPGQLDAAGRARQDPPFEVEVLVADPAGYVTVYLGEVAGRRATLASDLVARTATAAEMTASRRLYGLVDDDLLWAWDIAAFGQPLSAYLAARLHRQTSRLTDHQTAGSTDHQTAGSLRPPSRPD